MQGTAVVQFKFFRLFKSFTNRHLEGRKASPRFRQRASSPEDLVFYVSKTKGSSDPIRSLKKARPH